MNGKELEPVLYHGVASGHGKYMAAKIAKTNDLIINQETGKPFSWDEIVSE